MSEAIYPLYQPQVLQETCEGICRLDVRDQMLANRELELCGPIDAESAAILIRSLLYLQRADASRALMCYVYNQQSDALTNAYESPFISRRAPETKTSAAMLAAMPRQMVVTGQESICMTS